VKKALKPSVSSKVCCASKVLKRVSVSKPSGSLYWTMRDLQSFLSNPSRVRRWRWAMALGDGGQVAIAAAG